LEEWVDQLGSLRKQNEEGVMVKAEETTRVQEGNKGRARKNSSIFYNVQRHPHRQKNLLGRGRKKKVVTPHWTGKN